MARYTGPILKKCRALGLEPSVLGINKKSNRSSFTEKKKMSEYAIQLKEKQKARFVYGMLEKQFYKYYQESSRKAGITGENLLQLLERRLDNVAYRLGFAKTRRQARQVVTHAHLLINGQKVDIPSFRLKVGDVITVSESSKNMAIIKESVEGTTAPSWLSLDKEKLEAKVLQLPTRDAIDFDINEQLIIEFYSK